MSANNLTPSFKEEGLPSPDPQPEQSASTTAKAKTKTQEKREPTATTTTTKEQKGFLYHLFLGPGGAATMAGACEIVIFHPFDTTAKRLMSYNQRVVDLAHPSQTIKNFNQVVFGKLEEHFLDELVAQRLQAQAAATTTATATTVAPSSGAAATTALRQQLRHELDTRQIRIPLLSRVQHMYPGSMYAVLYKVLQRVIKFAGQPYMRDYLNDKHAYLFFQRNPNYKEDPQRPSGNKSAGSGSAGGPIKRGQYNEQYIRAGTGAAMLEATAGCMVGVSEVVLLPFDRMKVLHQTGNEEIKRMNMLQVVRQRGVRTLYAGLVTTALRNAPGSFLLFGGAAFTKEYIFGLQNYADATFTQNIIASTVGGCVGVIFTSPIDVVKTRVQSQKLSAAGQRSGLQVLLDTIKTEGFSAFYKGITPKLITSAPRLVFSYTLTQHFTKLLRGEKSVKK